ncbi:hypothetical protein Tco_0613708 [Tanacetum coccineum]
MVNAPSNNKLLKVLRLQLLLQLLKKRPKEVRVEEEALFDGNSFNEINEVLLIEDAKSLLKDVEKGFGENAANLI